ncbi:MAG: tRNA uridine-5-carboxymethylaminomethyl(34) synthesis GTPase MnmE [Spirochaetota bacterium]
MDRLTLDPDNPIVALATPWGTSAISVIRASGHGSIEKTAQIFSSPSRLLNAPGGTIMHGTLVAFDTGGAVDDVIIAVYRSPKSYTGQDSVEVFAHGSLPGIQRILMLFKSVGFRDAAPGEFTLRAFLNKKMDLTRAEAVREIVAAKTEQAHSLALHRLNGAVEARIRENKQKLLQIMAELEIQLDYPEDEVDYPVTRPPLESIDGVIKDIKALLETYRLGRIYQEGIRVALAGRTNAGKSSIFNIFLREDRSIVSEVHGTTRDYIESWISIEGVPVSLYDTAGLRKSDNPVEREGVRRAERVIENAHIILYVVDSVIGILKEDEEFFADRDCLKLWNKIDISRNPPPEGFIPLSALTGEGFLSLEKEILQIATSGRSILTGEVVIDSDRQRDLLKRGVDALENVKQAMGECLPLDVISLDLKDALDALGELTGEITTADILNEIFSRFCVGK